MNKRIFLIVLDGFGVGASEDAYKFGDEGSNTFKHVFECANPSIPNLIKLGIKNIDGLNFEKEQIVIGNYGKLRELSAGKDTTTGHFEMMDIVRKTPMPTFQNGFPKEIIEKLENAFKTKVIGNKVASGTEIIKEFGEENLKTGCPIVYTSADSVLQIATHVDIVTIEKLYEFCKLAREIMSGEYAVGRVIARPFKGKYPFERINEGRKDFSVIPDKNNTMQRLYNANVDVFTVGKISEVFAEKAITKSYLNHNNDDSIKICKKLVEDQNPGFYFVNLIDTDMVYGHRNNVQGYAKSLENTDKFIGEFINEMNENDILIITGDHGNDPFTTSTDHSREFVPLLIYGKNLPNNINFGTLDGFNQIGKFIEEVFLNNNKSKIGEMLWKK